MSRKTFLRQLAHATQSMVQGGLSSTTRTCGKPSCPCHSDPSRRHGPNLYFTWREDGKGHGRVGHRRVALSHVSCAPSSNWTCGFPASSSPAICVRRQAPQARQMAHPSHHWVQPTPFVQELVVP